MMHQFFVFINKEARSLLGTSKLQLTTDNASVNSDFLSKLRNYSAKEVKTWIRLTKPAHTLESLEAKGVTIRNGSIFFSKDCIYSLCRTTT